MSVNEAEYMRGRDSPNGLVELLRPSVNSARAPNCRGLSLVLPLWNM
jgi:hypothetical protein